MTLDLTELRGENDRLSTDNSVNNDFLGNFVKMPEGNGHVVVRLLPPAKSGLFDRDKSPFFQATRTHRVNNRSLHCPRELVGNRWKGECPICNYYSWLWKESETKGASEAEAMQAKARAIKPIERYYYNVIVRSQINEKSGEMEKNVGPKIFSVGKTLHKMIIRAIVGDESLDEKPLGDVTDFTNGRDFKLMKTMRQSGTQSYPNYSESKFLDPSPLGNPEEIEKWLAGVHDLVTLRTLKPLEELKEQLKVHLGLIPDKANGSGFDPTEFQKEAEASSKVSVVVEETVKAEESVEPTAPATPEATEGGDEALADDEFLEQLRNMS